MRTAAELADDILYSATVCEESLLILRIATRIIAESLFEAQLENGLPVRDASDFRLYTLELSEAFYKRLQARAKKIGEI